MSFTTAVLLSIFWLLIAALLGGLIVYFLMQNRSKLLKQNYEELQQKYKNLEKEQDKLKKDCEESQAALKAEIEQQKATIKEKQESLQTLEVQKAEGLSRSGRQEAKPITRDAKKQAELDRIRAKAKAFDYSNMGVATAEQKEDLKLISGIGPFIEEKLNALGIYTFAQISKFTEKDIEQVTEAIEFFPGRIQRDEWIKQAKERVAK